MTEWDDLLDDLFHGCAWAAFLDEAVLCQGEPDSDRVRRQAYRYYEEALARKNQSAGSTEGLGISHP